MSRRQLLATSINSNIIFSLQLEKWRNKHGKGELDDLKAAKMARHALESDVKVLMRDYQADYRSYHQKVLPALNALNEHKEEQKTARENTRVLEEETRELRYENRILQEENRVLREKVRDMEQSHQALAAEVKTVQCTVDGLRACFASTPESFFFFPSPNAAPRGEERD